MKHKTIKLVILILSLAGLVLALCLPGGEKRPVLVLLAGLVAGGLFTWYAPELTGLSPQNPKIKTVRRLSALTFLFVIGAAVLAVWPQPLEKQLGEQQVYRLLLVGVGVLLLCLGNAAPKLPFNRYMGLRLPWTVRDPDAWRAAHRCLGRLTFPVVGLCTLTGWITGWPQCIAAEVLILVVVPGVWSLVVYCKKWGVWPFRP